MIGSNNWCVAKDTIIGDGNAHYYIGMTLA